jgi:hypothetical protein
MNKFIDYESFFTYISLILAFSIFIVLMYGCIADNHSDHSIIERFSTTEPVHAVIASITVDPTTKAITGITLGANKGKYYKDRPPTITIPKPTAADSTQAEATAILKTTPIDGTTPQFYEIERIQITPGKAGTKYETADSSKITFGPSIAEYKAASAASAASVTEPVSAVIANITVDSTTKGIKEITLGANKGKYYKDKPPLITIGAPTDTTGTAATAEVKLKTAPITGLDLYEIDTITITNAGKNYVVSDSSKMILEPIDIYIARVNPVITLTTEQKDNIVALINKCTALKNKAPYVNKINTQTLRKTDVDAIIKEVGGT